MEFWWRDDEIDLTHTWIWHEPDHPTEPFFVLHVGVNRWLAVLLTSILPVGLVSRAAVKSLVRHRRRIRQRCIGCGYDLRATPEL
jgi:hypothetical protein